MLKIHPLHQHSQDLDRKRKSAIFHLSEAGLETLHEESDALLVLQTVRYQPSGEAVAPVPTELQICADPNDFVRLATYLLESFDPSPEYQTLKILKKIQNRLDVDP